MKKNTQDPLSRVKEKDLGNGKGVGQTTKTTQAQDWGEMVREDMASGCICIYSLPLSIKDEW